MGWVIGSLILFVLAGLIWFRVSKKDDKGNRVNPVYVCSECGEHHCNCYPEKKVE